MTARKVPGEGTPTPGTAETAVTRSDLSPVKNTGSVTSLRSVQRALESGSRRDLLVALRDKLWGAFHDERTQPRDLSPLTLRLKEIQAEIEAIDLREEDQYAADAAEDGTFDPESI